MFNITSLNIRVILNITCIPRVYYKVDTSMKPVYTSVFPTIKTIIPPSNPTPKKKTVPRFTVLSLSVLVRESSCLSLGLV